MADVFNVISYGATGNGTTDDSAAIQSAIRAAAAAKPASGIVYFPPGTYYVNTPSNLPFDLSNVGGSFTYSNATVTAGPAVQGAAVSCFAVSGTGGKTYALPNVTNFNNQNSAALAVDKCSLCRFTFNTFTNNGYGIFLSANGGSSLDNTFEFAAIGTAAGATQYGVVLWAYTGTDVIQGTIVRGNFITGVQFSIALFTASSSRIAPAINYNYWEIGNIDPGNDSNANKNVVVSSNLNNYGPNYVRVPGYFGGGGTVSTCVDLGTGNTINNFQIEASMSPGGYGTTYAAFNLNGAGNAFRTANPRTYQNGTLPYPGAATPSNPTSAYQASSTPNSRSTFNGGIPVLSNTFWASFAVSSNVPAGTQLDYFVYSPFLCGYDDVSFQMKDTGTNVVTCMYCVDRSVHADYVGGPYPNEIHLRFYTATALVAGTSWQGIVSVG